MTLGRFSISTGALLALAGAAVFLGLAFFVALRTWESLAAAGFTGSHWGAVILVLLGAGGLIAGFIALALRSRR